MSAPRVTTPPSHLGRYEVGTRVGGGGMAYVYVGRGVTEEGEEELVALKVIKDEFGNDPKFLRMFSDEAKILAGMYHPNVIRTFEYGIERDHRYIVMELLAGRTLYEAWELLNERGESLPFHLGAWICARVAEGLHAAHELTDRAGEPLQIVHRDVNPTNIFLTYTGEVKLIDFGLAKARVRRDKTSSGMVKGKIPYLAPEQLELLPVDRRIDVYALGTTLWEMGTMRRLFKRDSDLETLRAIKEATIPDPRTIVADFPEPLCEIIARALKQNRDERYQNAEDFRIDLDTYIARPNMEMRSELANLIARLYPGEWTMHASWRDEARAVKVMATAPPPPMPVPLASSNLLDPDIEIGEAEIEIIGF